MGYYLKMESIGLANGLGVEVEKRIKTIFFSILVGGYLKNRVMEEWW